MKKRLVKMAEILAIATLTIASMAGCDTKKEYEEVYTGDSWKVSYEKFTGEEEKDFKTKDGECIHIEVVTKDGNLSLKAENKKDKNVILDRENIKSSSFNIDESGNFVIAIKGEKHKGSISVKVQKKGEESEIEEKSSFSELLLELGKDEESKNVIHYSVSDKAQEFIMENEFLFPEGSEKKIKALTNEEVEYQNIIKNPERYGNGFMRLKKAEVVKIHEIALDNNQYVTEFLLKDKEDQYYWVIYNAECTNIVEGKKVQTYAVPIGVTEFEVTEGKKAEAVVLVAGLLKKAGIFG